MAGLTQSGGFAIDAAPLAAIRGEFAAEAVDEDAVVDEIRLTYDRAGYLLDPHSAIAVQAARRQLRAAPATPVVALATAHPAKFPDAVERAAGIRPQLPPHLADLMGRPERINVLPNDPAAIQHFIRREARAVRGNAA
jgi:threonine synthase